MSGVDRPMKPRDLARLIHRGEEVGLTMMDFLEISGILSYKTYRILVTPEIIWFNVPEQGENDE